MAKKKYIIPSGAVFGRLTYVRDAEPRPNQPRIGVFRCDCGNEFETQVRHAKSGHVKTCGCYRRPQDVAAERKAIYNIWRQMIQRCENPRRRGYENYGGRGIAVCERWHSFESFLDDMGERPEGMTLDRYPDTNGNYEPGNCRWATNQEQANNKRNTIILEFRGQSLTLMQWCDDLRLNPAAIRQRIKFGWSIESALTTPTRPYERE